MHEGTVWYQRSFNYKKAKEGNRVYLYFGAANYRADVYLNAKKLGSHIGGFTPFSFEVPDSILKREDNFLVVKVDNKRGKQEVPTVNTDWWNYGGITRTVQLVEVPQTFIRDFSLQLKKPAPGAKLSTKNAVVEGWMKLNGNNAGQVTIDIPELKVKKTITATDSVVPISITLPNVRLWSPQNPKRYEVVLRTADDVVTDKIGFRTIQADGEKLLLNGEPVFLRGYFCARRMGAGRKESPW